MISSQLETMNVLSKCRHCGIKRTKILDTVFALNRVTDQKNREMSLTPGYLVKTAEWLCLL